MPKPNLNKVVKAFQNNAGVRLPKEQYGTYGFGDSAYDVKDDKEFIQVSRKTMIPGIVKLVGKVYEVPKGSMNTAKAERGKTESRMKNTEKRAEKARQPKKLY